MSGHQNIPCVDGPRLHDAFCCQGGTSAGYAQAGFTVDGSDLAPQPRYPYAFHHGDSIHYLLEHGHEYDALAGSPPCQGYSDCQRIQGRDHAKLIAATRAAMRATGKPYVIENVEGARGELDNPVLLCGTMFGLRTRRHRLFESNLPLVTPEHDEEACRAARHTKMGRQPRDGEFMHVVGNFTNVDLARQIMGAPWMNRDGLREAIPPVYTAYLGAQVLEHIQAQVAA